MDVGEKEVEMDCVTIKDDALVERLKNRELQEKPADRGKGS